MRKSLSMITMVMGALALMASVFISTVGAAPATDLHCPDKDNPAKVENAESAGDLVFEAGTEFCAKKGTGATGTIVADGETTLYEYLVAYGIDGESGEGPSYYIVYAEPTTTVPPTTTPPTTEPPCDETDPESECYEPPSTTVPPTTTPPTTAPPVTEPPTTEPPTTEPPVTTEPPTTEPPVTEPPVVEPPQLGRPLVINRPVVVDRRPVVMESTVTRTQLAETGASDLVPVLTLVGIALLASGVILSRKSSTV